jgi:hypothetical protein
MEPDIFEGRLWLDQIKSIGSGPDQQVIEFQEFNAAEVKEYRAVLDDIAKEVGGRAQKQEITGSFKAYMVDIGGDVGSSHNEAAETE